MKKFTKIAFIILIAVIIILAFALYTKASNNNSGSDNAQKDKTFAEIKYLESKLTDLLNAMNNIEFENYDISVGKIESESGEESDSGASSGSSGSSSSESGSGGSGGSSGGGESGGSESSGSGGSSGGSSEGGSQSSQSKSSEKENKKFDLKSSGVLVDEKEINWDNVKTEVEVMYTAIPTILLDLQYLEINEEDIKDFSKKYDELIMNVREEEKEKTLENLSELYEYVPKFANNATDNEFDKTVLQTKNSIFKAYSKLDKKEWSKIEEDLKKATETYSKLMSNEQVDTNKKFTVNKTNIILKELENSVEIEDEAVFLIKYKNLLEELNNL